MPQIAFIRCNEIDKSRKLAKILIGHNFGPAILQAYLTTDVYEKNYGGHDTRLWGRVILPLWTAPNAPPVATPLDRK